MCVAGALGGCAPPFIILSLSVMLVVFYQGLLAIITNYYKNLKKLKSIAYEDYYRELMFNRFVFSLFIWLFLFTYLSSLARAFLASMVCEQTVSIFDEVIYFLLFLDGTSILFFFYAVRRYDKFIRTIAF